MLERMAISTTWSKNAIAGVTVVVGIVAMASGGCRNGDIVSVADPLGQPSSVSEEPEEVLDLMDAFSMAVISSAALEYSGDSKPRKPFINSERGVLFVPLGTEISYDVELPPFAKLVSHDARSIGSATGVLEVVWIPDGRAERIVTRDLTAESDRGACLGNAVLESGRLSLRARDLGVGREPLAGIRVFRPSVMVGNECRSRKTVEPESGDGARPNIVVYLIDALRADRVGCYGYDRNTTPHLDKFASQSLVFSGAQAQTSWTRTAVASIFTGLLPQQHGAIGKKDVLPDSATTMAELLSAAGYECAAVVSNGNVSQMYGFSQGFSYFKYLQEVEIGEHVVRSDAVNEAVFAWLDEVRGSRPFFLYVHTVDPHLPYAPPERFRRSFAPEVDDPAIGSVESVNELAADRSKVTPELIEGLSALYDGEVAANDAVLGELLDGLEERNLTSDSVIMVLSDHGEEFFDHNGWTHGNTLFAEMLDVPLVVRVPGVAPKEIEEIVQHVDLFSTLLDLAGVESPNDVFGRSARALWTSEAEPEWNDRGLAHLEIKTRFGESWADSRWKMITRRLANGELENLLFDRVADPTEKKNLAAQRPELVQELLARYHDLVEAEGERLSQGEGEGEVNAEVEGEVEAQLRALGYL